MAPKSLRSRALRTIWGCVTEEPHNSICPCGYASRLIPAVNGAPTKPRCGKGFANGYLARAQETGAASPENIKNKRTEANEAWYALRDLINAHFIIEKVAAPYGPTVTFINGLIEYYNNLIARRGQGEEVPEVPAPAPVA